MEKHKMQCFSYRLPPVHSWRYIELSLYIVTTLLGAVLRIVTPGFCRLPGALVMTMRKKMVRHPGYASCRVFHGTDECGWLYVMKQTHAWEQIPQSQRLLQLISFRFLQGN
ncbi:hypothetical protein FQN60_015875 [Etheostoma spectabile]|uniref:Uncharacterized protein n=1 Tax=Etheostoma spectabile TaxID=54343 RepID=A0A5J5CR44_9PERO|nr:hypothetical protein FQN60_015875 [Etheostoma spectabile]